MVSFGRAFLRHCGYDLHTTLIIPMPRPPHVPNNLFRLGYSYLTLL